MTKRKSLFRPVTPPSDLGSLLSGNQQGGETISESKNKIETDESKGLSNKAAETAQMSKQEEIKETITPGIVKSEAKPKEVAKKESKKKGVEKLEAGSKKHILASERTNYYIKMRKAQLGLMNAEDVLIMAFEELDKKLDKKFGPIIYPY